MGVVLLSCSFSGVSSGGNTCKPNQQKSDCTIQSSREPAEEEKHLQSVLGADMLVPTMVSRMCILLKFVLGHVHRNSLGFLKLSSVRCYRGNKENMRTEQAKP